MVAFSDVAPYDDEEDNGQKDGSRSNEAGREGCLFPYQIGFPAFFFQSLLFFLLDAFQELRDTVVEFETCVPKPFRLRVDTLSPSAVIQFHAAFYAVQNVCKGVSCVELLMNRVRF